MVGLAFGLMPIAGDLKLINSLLFPFGVTGRIGEVGLLIGISNSPFDCC